jgi:putative methionine-R-sulfoxide reductase with GAF domain
MLAALELTQAVISPRVVRLPAASLAWSDHLVDVLRTEDLFGYVAVFLAVDGALVLAAEQPGPQPGEQRPTPGTWAVPLEGSVVGRVFLTAMPALIGDIRLDRDYRDVPGLSSRSELAVPIRRGDATMGVVNLESRRVGTYGISDLERVLAQIEAAVPALPVEPPAEA